MKTKRVVSTFLVILLISYTASLMSGILIQKAHAQETVFVTPATNVYEVTDPPTEFTISINISFAEGVRTWELKLRFDGSILYTDKSMIEEGNFLDQYGAQTFFAEDVTSNTIALSCLIIAEDWSDGDGNLATIRFRVIDNGKVDLDLYDTVFYDVGFNPIDPQPDPVDGVFYTTTPKAYFSMLPSKNPGTTQTIPPAYLLRDPVIEESITFNATAFMSGSFYKGSYDPDGSIVSYDWDFGDTTIGSGQVVAHSYSAEGTYIVTLTVTDNDAKTDEYLRNDVKVDKRDVALTGLQISPATASPGEDVFVKVNVTNLGVTAEFINVTLYYDDALIWYNQTEGKSAFSTVHEIDPVSRTKPLQFPPGKTITVNYTWSTIGIAEGVYTLKANVSMVTQSATQFLRDYYQTELDFNTLNNNMTYSPLTITSLHNLAVSSITLSPTLKTPNIIQFGTTQVTVEVKVKNTGDFDETFNVTLTMDSTSLKNWTDVFLASKTETTLQYTWDTSTLLIGNYTLKAQATNATGEVEQGRTDDNTFTLQTSVTVQPIASFTYAPLHPAVGQTVRFNATTSQAAQGWVITKYEWRVNGIVVPTMTTDTPERSFLSGADYNVSLTVTDSIGLTGSMYQIIHVGIPPSAQFTFAPAAPKADEQVIFDASQSQPNSDGSNGDVIVRYLWNFGDGSTANVTTTTTTHSFAKGGNFTVTLTAIDNEGLNATVTKFAVVGKLSSTISMSTQPQSLLVGGTVTMSGQIQPARSQVIVNILLRLQGTTSWTSIYNATTNASGRYNYDWVTSAYAPGNYTLKARWEGDDKYNGAESPINTIEVNPTSPPPQTQDFTIYLYLAGGVIIVLTAIGIAFYMIKRRK